MKKKKTLTAPDKVALVCNTKEIKECVSILYLLFEDIKAKSFIRYEYKIKNREFEIIFQEVKKGNVK
jgi:hypothetical protein